MANRTTDFSKWKVVDLKEFLRLRNKPRPGLKADLVRLCKIYSNTPVVLPSASAPDSSVSSEIFRADLVWEDFSRPLSIPQQFNISSLIEYLSECTLRMSVAVPEDSGEDETVFDSSTKKPSVKGRRMYASKKIQLLEKSQLCNGGIAFRCNMTASFGKDCRYPRVALDPRGLIIDASCSCIQRADKRCCHVAALLFCIEDISLGNEPNLSLPCTSQPQKWGHGSRTKNSPSPLHKEKYTKKMSTDKQYGWDPRPKHLQETKQQEIDFFIKDLQISQLNSMWQQLLVFEYDDYPLLPSREILLKQQVREAVEHFSVNLMPFATDSKSNSLGIHITGTEEQSDCDLWRKTRLLRVTASNVKDFSINPYSQISKLWEFKSLDHVPAIKWGLQNEEKARLEYERVTGNKAEKCGIFISKLFPYCGASPDGWMDNGKGILEIKCPYVLKDKHPTDLNSLLKEQKSAFPCSLKDSRLELKKSHKYYYQVQCQLFVTGAEYCDFVV